jgi:hypothetical protein
MRKEYNDRVFGERPVAHEPTSVRVETPLGPTATPHHKEYIRRAEVPLVETNPASSDLAAAVGPASQEKSEAQLTP